MYDYNIIYGEGDPVADLGLENVVIKRLHEFTVSEISQMSTEQLEAFPAADFLELSTAQQKAVPELILLQKGIEAGQGIESLLNTASKEHVISKLPWEKMAADMTAAEFNGLKYVMYTLFILTFTCQADGLPFTKSARADFTGWLISVLVVGDCCAVQVHGIPYTTHTYTQ